MAFKVARMRDSIMEGHDELIICRKSDSEEVGLQDVKDATIPKYTALNSRENPQLFYCACDGGSRPKAIDPYGYHLVGCKNGANAIRLHDEVVVTVAKLFRTLCVDAIVEPMRLFTDAGRRRA